MAAVVVLAADAGDNLVHGSSAGTSTGHSKVHRYRPPTPPPPSLLVLLVPVLLLLVAATASETATSCCEIQDGHAKVECSQ